MILNKLLRQAIALFLSIVFFYILTHFLHLYWYIWWVDIVLHFFSGLTVGMLVTFFWAKYVDSSNRAINKVRVMEIAFVASLIIGIFWEELEIYFGLVSIGGGAGYILDSFSDLILNISGAILGTIYSFYLLEKKS